MGADNNINDKGKVKLFTTYFTRMMKFYDMKLEFFTPVIFVLMLAVSFGIKIFMISDFQEFNYRFTEFARNIQLMMNNSQSGTLDYTYFFSEDYLNLIDISFKIITFIVFQQVLLFLFSTLYLTFYFYEIKNNGIQFKEGLILFFKKLPKIIVYNTLFYLAIFIMVIVLLMISSIITVFVPLFAGIVYFGIILFAFYMEIVFIFRNIIIVDTRLGLGQTFSIAAKMSKKDRVIIIRNVLFVIVLLLLITTIAAGSQLAVAFIMSFFEVVILLILQRLIVLMYNDINFNEKTDEEPQINE